MFCEDAKTKLSNHTSLHRKNTEPDASVLCIRILCEKFKDIMIMSHFSALEKCRVQTFETSYFSALEACRSITVTEIHESR